jgi:hypothetical protein
MFFLAVNCLLFYRWNEKPQVIFGGVSEIFSYLTSQVESPIEILKILIFNILSVKPNIKDYGHSRRGFIFFILLLSSFFFPLLPHSLIFVHDLSRNQASSSLLILRYVVFLHFSPYFSIFQVF